MNKRKIALFVEGQAEYIFVRDFLLSWYDYDCDRVGVECFEFHAGNTNGVPYPFGSRDSETFYQIYNVGNDRSVLSKIRKEADRMRNAGFQLIVGLCDMYGDDYHKMSKNRQIDARINQRFIEARNQVIKDASLEDFVHFHFAIMEVEAWFLGMYTYLQKIDPSLTPRLILQKLHLDITADPEVTVYHPAKTLDDIYSLAGRQYGKHEGDISAITGALSKADYLQLMDSGKCSSFARFAKDIL